MLIGPPGTGKSRLLNALGHTACEKGFSVQFTRVVDVINVISTNRAFRDWGAIFDVDDTLATAMIGRLMHHGEAMVIQGDSCRTKDKPGN